ncbi:hypothetical protein F4781DRAFT_201683 [Annulohypoxylon bovei var. microspora]|nr:hypothetical protein F4781DRAFT_201683 [Annulohypoxylon bovei var. microspora]
MASLNYSPCQSNSLSSATLISLPVELLTSILSYLPNRDVKNVRQTCTLLLGVARLRLSRVFLSANPRNISVFRAIADHETFRKEVSEIVWDDARLVKYPVNHRNFYVEYNQSPELWDCKPAHNTGVPVWFMPICKNNMEELRRRRGRDVDTPAHITRFRQLGAQLSYPESWSYYQTLLKQQEEILDTGADIEAFKYGLQRFPALRRIVITPAAHGWLYTPLYETPMIRGFPYGFNYPLPRGWPCTDEGDPTPRVYAWDDEEEKNKWRGFRLVTRELARQKHQISELLVDSHYLNTGLSCRIFDEPCDEYNDFVALLRTPGFRRLDLDLLVGGQEHRGWASFRNGHLRHALGEADLEHISLRTGVVPNPDANALVRGSGGSMEHHIPLRSIFPTEKWPRLRHFGLSGFLVQQADVLSLLATLPATLRSVELSFFYFLDHGGNYMSLLEDMRDTLGWRERPAHARPRVAVGVHLHQPRAGRAIWIGGEVDAFLYGGGRNPFGRDGWAKNQVSVGRGAVRDAFDPAHERPYVDFSSYMRLGYYSKSAWLDERRPPADCLEQL